jgi:hypothetical protein
MAKKFPRCIICGQDIAHKIKLPGGSINLCTNQDCLDELNYRINDGSIPVVWFSMNDFINHDEATEEIARPLLGDATIATFLAREVGSFIWGGETLGQLWHDALDESIGTLEEFYIGRLKDAELPLVNIDSLKTEKGKQLLEKRLKGEPHGS